MKNGLAKKWSVSWTAEKCSRYLKIFLGADDQSKYGSKNAANLVFVGQSFRWK